jgi:DNA-binding NarL/FixJ family response regulator
MEKHMRILIADHEAHIRQALQALLATWPEIEVVGLDNSGAGIVRLVETYQPEVVLMDLPVSGLAVSVAEEMDRLEAIRVIKSRWWQVRIVVLTLYTTHRAAALAAGADAFLLKGCPVEALRDALLNSEQVVARQVIPMVEGKPPAAVGELGQSA